MSLMYSAPRQSRVIMTPEMEIAFSRVTLSHRGPGQMVAVVGPSGAGKTTAMMELSKQLNTDGEANVPNAWRTLYYVTADLARQHPTGLERHVLAQMLSDGLRMAVDKDLRRCRAEDLRQRILLALRHRNVQMIFIDEAGQIPATGLNALANLVNTAEVMFEWPLTIVLIGMDELPLTIGQLPQVERRVVDTVLFQPYSSEDALDALAQVEPFFASLDSSTEEGSTVMEFLTSPEVSRGGMLGLMIQLVQRTADHCQRDGRPLSLRDLRMVHQLSARDQRRAVESARNGWRTNASAPAATAPAAATAPGKRARAGGAQ